MKREDSLIINLNMTINYFLGSIIVSCLYMAYVLIAKITINKVFVFLCFSSLFTSVLILLIDIIFIILCNDN